MPFKAAISALAGNQYRICVFKDSHHRASKPFSPAHYYISVPCSSPNMFFLFLITSKIKTIETAWQRASNLYSVPNLIYLPHGHFQFLYAAQSVVDILQPVTETLLGLNSRIDVTMGFNVRSEIVDPTLRKELYDSIQANSLIDPEWKNAALP